MNSYLKSTAEVPQPKLTLETPDLQILPIDKLVPHELPDEQRSTPLTQNLRRDAVLKNPPVVAELNPDDRTYIVLDGANRISAFQELNVPHIVAQIVPYEPPYVELHTWYHVISGVSHKPFETHLHSLTDLEIDDANILHARAELARRAVLAYCVFSNGRVITLAGGGLDLHQRTQLLHQIVGTYIHTGKLDRTNTDQLNQLIDTYPDMAAAIIFPQYEPVEVMDVTQRGLKLPPGLTRHIIHGRALRVNYPLDKLAGSESLESKNQALRGWVRERFNQRHVRFYAESTFLFDE